MPYASNDELPSAVRSRLSDRCQTVWRESFNAVSYDGRPDSEAFAIANVAANECVNKVEKQVEVVATIAKRDEPRQVAFGVVLEPRSADAPDLQGDYYDERDVEDAAYGFMAEVTKGSGFSDVMHDGVTRAGYPVESFIAPVDFTLGDQHVAKGSWVIGMHYPDKDIWDGIVKGRYSAFSVGGAGVRISGAS